AEAALVLLNGDPERPAVLDGGQLIGDCGGYFDRFTDLTPQRSPIALAPKAHVALEPLGLRVFRAQRRAVPASGLERPARSLEALARNRLAIEAVEPELDS